MLNPSLFRRWSQKRPLKRLINSFCAVLTGWIKYRSTPCRFAHCLLYWFIRRFLISAYRIRLVSTKCNDVQNTRALPPWNPEILKAALNVRHSFVKSSTHLLPMASASMTKFIDPLRLCTIAQRCGIPSFASSARHPLYFSAHYVEKCGSPTCG